MSVDSQHHFVARSAQMAALDAPVSRGAYARISPALRYSSPRPWLLAVSISSGMWAGIIWTVWRIL
jgi:hypothetical protein